MKPFLLNRATHELMDANADLGLCGLERVEVSLQALHGLRHEAAHRQANREVQGLGFLVNEQPPRPRQRDFRLSEPGWNWQYVGETDKSNLDLPVVRRESTGRYAEEILERFFARVTRQAHLRLHRAVACEAIYRDRLA